MTNFFDILIKKWDSIHKLIRLLIIIIIVVILCYWINDLLLRFIFILFLLVCFILDVAFPYFREKIKKGQKAISKRKEEKRVESLIMKSAKQTNPINYDIFFPYKFKVRGLSPKEKSKSFVETAKKTLILKEQIGENKSKNVADFVNFATNVGYLPQLWECFTQKLSKLITYEKTREILSKTGDMKAIRIFVSNYDLKKEGIEHEDRKAYHTLVMENAFNELFVPLLLFYKSKNKPLDDNFRKEVEELFIWLPNKEKRLLEVSPTKFLPKFSYVYAKRIRVPISAHIDRAIEKFESKKCEFCVIGAFEDSKKDLKSISGELCELYPFIKSFEGYSTDREEKERKARYNIHKVETSDLTLDLNKISKT